MTMEVDIFMKTKTAERKVTEEQMAAVANSRLKYLIRSFNPAGSGTPNRGRMDSRSCKHLPPQIRGK